MTVGLAICDFAYAVNYNHTFILHGYGDLKTGGFGGNDLDLFGSRDVTGHVTIGLTKCGFL